MSRHRGFTRAERERSLSKRAKNAAERRAKVRSMLRQKKTKAEIARRLGVDWKTIHRDCKVIEAEAETPTDAVREATDAILEISHRAGTGEITETEARYEIQRVIETVANREDSDV